MFYFFNFRKDNITLAMKTETEEFEGCGLELPDLVYQRINLLRNNMFKNFFISLTENLSTTFVIGMASFGLFKISSLLD